MTTGNKIILFEYILLKLSIEFERVNGSFAKNNDFSKLKVIKLHFFVCSLNSKLLAIFDKFSAMPYGPVEEDILDAINNDSLIYYKIDSHKTLIKGIAPTIETMLTDNLELAQEFKEADKAITLLLKINADLIILSASDLVEISHQWTSWSNAFERARANQKKKERISPQEIENEPLKIYGHN